MNKKPQIRFNGFDDSWEQHKLGDIGTTYTGLSGKTKEDFGHGKASFVTYMNVFSNPVAKPESVEHVEVDNKQNEVKCGDVFFTTSSETPEEVGMSSVWFENKPNIYLNSFCFGYRPNIEIDNYYLAYLLRSNTFRKDITLLAQGISRYNISKNKVMDIQISLPTTKEQSLIGNYFNQLDNLISLHQRKLDSLLNSKKYFLKRMFIQGNEKIPKVRFKEYDDLWTTSTLNDVTKELYNGQTPSRLEKSYWNGSINWLSSGELNKGHVKRTIEKITKEGKDEANLKIIPKGTFVIAITGLEATGTRGNCCILDIDTTLNQSCMAIIPNEKINTLFLFYWYQLVGNDYGFNYSQGTKQQSFNSEIIKKFPITYPKDTKEQEKIAEFFEKMDRSIENQKQMIEHMKNMKKAYLKKLFI